MWPSTLMGYINEFIYSRCSYSTIGSQVETFIFIRCGCKKYRTELRTDFSKRFCSSRTINTQPLHFNMTSTDIKIGLTNSARTSSRVLKPPGGGHSNIFAEPDVAINAPRPKYNQQNSSNLTACMGTTDANEVVEKLREDMTKQVAEQKDKTEEATEAKCSAKNPSTITNGDSGGDQVQRGRVPPGGFSSGGFW